MEFGGAKRWGDASESSFWVATQVTKEAAVFMRKGLSHYVILLC